MCNICGKEHTERDIKIEGFNSAKRQFDNYYVCRGCTKRFNPMDIDDLHSNSHMSLISDSDMHEGFKLFEGGNQTRLTLYEIERFFKGELTPKEVNILRNDYRINESEFLSDEFYDKDGLAICPMDESKYQRHLEYDVRYCSKYYDKKLIKKIEKYLGIKFETEEDDFDEINEETPKSKKNKSVKTTVSKNTNIHSSAKRMINMAMHNHLRGRR